VRFGSSLGLVFKQVLLLSGTLVLLGATAAWGRPAPLSDAPAWSNGWTALRPSAHSTPHPAVVRIIAPGRDSMSLGSGSLVAVNETHGLVITNWHVVCEATGQITVVFPDGFRSPAAVLRTDRDWDLAALAIWRPQVAPVTISNQTPRPGETLTIAGYGSDSYRAVSGRCTQYVSPGPKRPFEMVELAAGARQGDSGGPILNSRGELAGVLFGTARGRTTGSYCGRVRQFLAPLGTDFPRLAPGGTMFALQPRTTPPAQAVHDPVAANEPPAPYAAIGVGQITAIPEPSAPPPAVQIDDGWRRPPPATTTPNAAAPSGGLARPSIAAPQATTTTPTPADSPDAYRMEQIKNVLAVVGGLAIFFHSLRLVSMLQT
jgi:hypothetical protein